MFKLIQNKLKKKSTKTILASEIFLTYSKWSYFLIHCDSRKTLKVMDLSDCSNLSFFICSRTKNKEYGFLILIKVAPSQTFFSSMSAFDFKHTCTKCILALIITKNAFHSILISTINYHDNMNISYTYILCWWYEIVQESV